MARAHFTLLAIAFTLAVMHVGGLAVPGRSVEETTQLHRLFGESEGHDHHHSEHHSSHDEQSSNEHHDDSYDHKEHHDQEHDRYHHLNSSAMGDHSAFARGNNGSSQSMDVEDAAIAPAEGSTDGSSSSREEQPRSRASVRARASPSAAAPAPASGVDWSYFFNNTRTADKSYNCTTENNVSAMIYGKANGAPANTTNLDVRKICNEYNKQTYGEFADWKYYFDHYLKPDGTYDCSDAVILHVMDDIAINAVPFNDDITGISATAHCQTLLDEQAAGELPRIAAPAAP